MWCTWLRNPFGSKLNLALCFHRTVLLELTFLSVRKTKADFFFLNESDTRAQLVGDDVLVFLFGLDRALGRSKHRSVCPSNGFQNKSAVLSIDAIFLKPNS